MTEMCLKTNVAVIMTYMYIHYYNSLFTYEIIFIQ